MKRNDKQAASAKIKKADRQKVQMKGISIQMTSDNYLEDQG